MSRIGRNPISVPATVNVSVNGTIVSVNGPKGTLTQEISPFLSLNNENNVITLVNNSTDKKAKKMHGLYRQLINNMIIGVSEGFTKTCIISGIGYKAVMKGNDCEVNLGYSHPILIKAEEGITLSCGRDAATKKDFVTVSGISKEKVGQFASKIRDLRPVEPYHAYGVYYSNEVVRRKEVKSGKK